MHALYDLAIVGAVKLHKWDTYTIYNLGNALRRETDC